LRRWIWAVALIALVGFVAVFADRKTVFGVHDVVTAKHILEGGPTGLRMHVSVSHFSDDVKYSSTFKQIIFRFRGQWRLFQVCYAPDKTSRREYAQSTPVFFNEFGGLDRFRDGVCEFVLKSASHVIGWSLPEVLDHRLDKGTFGFEVKKLGSVANDVCPKLGLGRFFCHRDRILGGFCGIDGGFGCLSRISEREYQQANTNRSGAKLPPRNDHQVKGRLSHGLLGLKIGFFTLLGGLAAGVAGWFGGPLALDGRGWRRLGGCGLLLSGGLGCFVLWGWGLYDSPLALFERGGRFFSLLLG
jgi:hypothetical protein